MTLDLIDYGKLVDDAMHIIVSKVLKEVQEKGLPGNHHFFISFVTKYPGVKLSKVLQNKYPREMTIVLQFQFQDLVADDKGFGVSLSFNGTKEYIYIPYAAITTFADPSVQFGLQFREVGYSFEDHDDIDIDLDLDIDEGFLSKIPLDKSLTKSKKSKQPDINKGKDKADSKKSSNVVSLEKFRDKK